MKEARHVFCEFTYVECPEWVNPQRLKADSWLPVAEGEGNWKRPPDGHGFPFSGDENILEFDSGDSGTTLEHTKKPTKCPV